MLNTTIMVNGILDMRTKECFPLHCTYRLNLFSNQQSSPTKGKKKVLCVYGEIVRENKKIEEMKCMMALLYARKRKRKKIETHFYHYPNSMTPNIS